MQKGTIFKLLLIICLLFAGLEQTMATDLAVGLIFVPEDTTTTNEPIRVSFEVQNLNVLTADEYKCYIDIYDPMEQRIFNRELVKRNLKPFTIDTVYADSLFTPMESGEYTLQITVVFQDEINPSNNFKEMKFQSVEKEQFLSRESAIQIFEEGYFSLSKYADQAVAFLYNATGSDSLLKPGDTVAPFDSSFQQEIDNYSYLFWVDNFPEEEWFHPANFIIMNAVTGAMNILGGVSWPVINGQEYTEFTESGNASPNLLFGLYPISALSLSYTPVDTENERDCAIIVVGKNFHGEGEKNARVNDIARIKELFNGVDGGPKIDKDRIMVVPGEDTNGATITEVHNAFEMMKEKKCRKLYYYYMGHGKKGAMILKKENNKSDYLTYGELAKKLKDAKSKEVCVVIEACFSGTAIDSFKTSRLKGLILTSSSKDSTTIRFADGVPFNKAVYECSKDPNADLNKNGRVTLEEAVAWAISQDEVVRRKKPQGDFLGDKNRIAFKHMEPIKFTTGFTGGTLNWEWVPVCYAIKKGKKVKRIICRSKLYVENPSSGPYAGNGRRAYIICTDKKGRSRVLGSWQPQLGPKQRKCITEIPAGCANIRVSPSPQGSFRFLAQTEEGSPVTLSQVNEYQPGEYIFQTIGLYPNPGDMFSNSIQGPDDWELEIDPEAFEASAFLDSHTVVIRGTIPDTASFGAMYSLELVNFTRSDTMRYPFTALLTDTLDKEIKDNDRHSFKAISTTAGVTASQGNISIDNSTITFEQPAFISVEPGGSLTMENTSVISDSGAGYGVNVRGHIDWSYAAVIGPEEGITFDNPTGSIYNSAVIGSLDDGVKFYGDMSGIQINFLDVDSSAINGLYFETVDNCSLSNVSISKSSEMDISLNINSEVFLLDSDYEANKESVDETSMLTRAWTTHFYLTDRNDQPLENADVTILDGTGTIVALDTTVASGFSNAFHLIQYVNNGGAVTLKTPHQVRIMNANFDTTFAYSADSSRVHRVKLNSFTIDVADQKDAVPARFSLEQNYPNPFNPSTTIRYQIAVPGFAELKIYNQTGQEIKSLINGEQPVGTFEVTWDGTNNLGDVVSSGVYISRLNTGTFTQSRKMLFLK